MQTIFSSPSHAASSVLPAIALLAMLAPGFGSRTKARPLRREVSSASAEALKELQRNPEARFLVAPAGEAVLGLEYAAEGNLLVHYIGRHGALSIAGGWLGAGRRRYIWLPLRHTLAWDQFAGPSLSPKEIGRLAADIHAGLDHLGERHVLEEFLQPVPIPEAERREVLQSYLDFMQTHGWQVMYDESFSRRSLRRLSKEEGPQRWSSADREILVRMEALVAETLKGVRPSSRVLHQTK